MRPESCRLWDGVNARNRKMISAHGVHACRVFVHSNVRICTFDYWDVCARPPSVCGSGM